MNGRQAGFTLLELLVVLTLAGLLLSAATGSVRMAARAWEGVASATQRTEAIVRLDRTLRRQLRSSIPAGALGAVPGRPPLFSGAADGFGWVARTPSAAVAPGLYGQRVRVDEEGALILESWRLDRPDAIDTAPLWPAGAAIAFAYHGAPVPGTAPQWHPRWTPGPIPPALVRLRIGTGDAARLIVLPTG